MTTTTYGELRRAPARKGALGTAFHRVADWIEIRRTEAILRAMTDRELLDIGVPREEIHEVARAGRARD